MLVQPEVLRFTYQDRSGSVTERTVEPAGLLGTSSGWFMVAWCRLRQGARTFRLDRMTHAARTGETITPPDLDALLAELPHDLAVPILR